MADQASKPMMKGGTKDFNWTDVRHMSYKDRESYLGYTVKIGFLDKGGKWRRRDWWKAKKSGGDNVADEELRKVKERDEKRMRIALGLEQKEEEFELPKMSGEEARYMTQKIKKEAEMEEEDEKIEIMPGLGFKGGENLSTERSKKALLDTNKALRLEGYGMEELEKQKRQKEKEIEKLKKDRKSKNELSDDENDLEEIKKMNKRIEKEKKRAKKKSKKKSKKKEKKEKKKRNKKKAEKNKMYRMYNL